MLRSPETDESAAPLPSKFLVSRAGEEARWFQQMHSGSLLCSTSNWVTALTSFQHQLPHGLGLCPKGVCREEVLARIVYLDGLRASIIMPIGQTTSCTPRQKSLLAERKQKREKATGDPPHTRSSRRIALCGCASAVLIGSLHLLPTEDIER